MTRRVVVGGRRQTAPVLTSRSRLNEPTPTFALSYRRAVFRRSRIFGRLALMLGAAMLVLSTAPAHAIPDGNCCCNLSGGSSTCVVADATTCESSTLCTFLGFAVCPSSDAPCPKRNGVSCTDNMECFTVCIAQTCSDPAGVGGSCDPGDNEDCVGDAVCTTDGTCVASGGCTSDADCPDQNPDDCQRSTCNTSTGVCAQVPREDGTLCEDGDACTAEDRCMSGECKPGVGPPICPPPNPPLDQCNFLSCDPNGGLFNCDVVTPLPDGTSCKNTDQCSVGDMCQNGTCVEGTPIDCGRDLICVDGDCVSPVEEVIVSLKPGACPPVPLSRRGKGVLSAVIPGTPDFDVRDVDVDTLHLSRTDSDSSVAPARIAFEDVGGSNGSDACGAEPVPDGTTDLSLKFPLTQLVPVLELDCSAAGTLLSLQLSGQLEDGSRFSGTDLARLVGPGCACDECERYVDGRCTPCPPDTVCVGNGTSESVSSMAADTEGDPECLTPCTSALDCLSSSRCEECRDGFCRSRCPGTCGDQPQPCMECDGAGTCRPCCPEAQFCPPLALDCRLCCQADQTCSEDQCVGCTSDEDCNTKECEECRDGMCVSKCTADERCIFGTCRPKCDDHSDCPECQVCIEGSDTSHCTPCAESNCDLCPFCKRCGPDEDCVETMCVPR